MAHAGRYQAGYMPVVYLAQVLLTYSLSSNLIWWKIEMTSNVGNVNVAPNKPIFLQSDNAGSLPQNLEGEIGFMEMLQVLCKEPGDQLTELAIASLPKELSVILQDNQAFLKDIISEQAESAISIADAMLERRPVLLASQGPLELGHEEEHCNLLYLRPALSISQDVSTADEAMPTLDEQENSFFLMSASGEETENLLILPVKLMVKESHEAKSSDHQLDLSALYTLEENGGELIKSLPIVIDHNNASIKYVKTAENVQHQAESIVQQVAFKIKNLSSSKDQQLMQIQLAPSKLGKVDVLFCHKGQCTNVTFVAEKFDAYIALSQNQDQLKELMSKSGLDMENLSFSFDMHKQDSSDKGQNFHLSRTKVQNKQVGVENWLENFSQSDNVYIVTIESYKIDIKV